MPTITFNGTPYFFSPGATVLEAARQNAIRIPTLCHHPALKNVGACRLCMVEIDGMRGTPTACTTPAADGMLVRTVTPALVELRREILSLILSEHPYTCLVCERHERCNEWQVTIRKAAVTTGCENCPKNGQCELQALVDETGLGTMIYPISYRGLPVEKEDPFFDRDYNLCILCGRCVRVCQDVRQTGTLAFVNRGPHTVVGTAFGQSHLLTHCEFCGSCVDVCPTGAIYDKRTKWEGVREKSVTTTCPYCSVGCQLELWVKGGKVMGLRPAAQGAVNAGMACARGRFGVIEMIHAPDRIRTPLIRKHGRLVEASWDEALEAAAQGLRPFVEDSSFPAFGLLASPHLTNEAAAALASFAKAVDSPYVDVPTALPRMARTAELAGLLRAERATALRSIRSARLIVAIGTNPRQSHPIAGLYIRQAQAEGAKLIVLDPRRTELAKRADEWIQVAPGQDIPAIQALIARPTSQIAPAVILYGSGVTHHPDSPDTIHAIHHLAQHLQAGVIALLGAANTAGVLDAGLLAATPDCGYEAIVEGMASHQIKALYVTGELPDLDQLANLDLLIVQDQFLSPQAAEFAHIVFPAASFAEMAGTLTNLEGHHQQLTPAIPAIGQARPDAWITSQLAARLPTSVRRTAITPPAFNRPAAVGDQEFSFTLLLERNAFAYRSSALTDHVRGMELYKPDEQRISIHPADAARLGVADHDLVKVVSAYGSDTFLAQLTPDLPDGTVFASINLAHGSCLFPGLLPALKTLAVNVEKA